MWQLKHTLIKSLTKYWRLILVGWFVIAIGLRVASPKWNDIVLDGDLDFIPASYPSRVTQQLLDKAFPDSRGRSQLSIVFARTDTKLTDADKRIMYDIARHLMHQSAVALFRREADSSILRSIKLKPVSYQSEDEVEKKSDRFDPIKTKRKQLLQRVRARLDEAIAMDQIWFDLTVDSKTNDVLANDSSVERLAIAYRDRSEIDELVEDYEAAKRDLDSARTMNPDIDTVASISQRPNEWSDLLDVWTWDDPILGSKLVDSNGFARMILMQFESDFMAVRNINTVDRCQKLIASIVPGYGKQTSANELKIGMSGSVVVGGDMLRAAADNIKQTEWITIFAVLFILCIMYRNPVLIAVPLLSIGLSLVISTSAIALLADHPNGHFVWKPLKVFSTSRIFIVVLLFGVGTDFCMFLIARFRESTERVVESLGEELNSMDVAIRRSIHRKCVEMSWLGVSDAIVGSGLTTIVGLSMLYFSDFEKFRFTGLLIAISLGITLIVCMTFTPCLLIALGRWVTTERRVREAVVAIAAKDNKDKARPGRRPEQERGLWNRIAMFVCTYPLAAFLVSAAALGGPAIYSLKIRGNVSYDLVKELSDNALSRRGIQLVAEHFTAFDASPITLLIIKPDRPDDDDMRDAIESLKGRLYEAGVVSVRTVSDPLGEFPPGKRMGLLSADAWRRRALERHPMVQSRYIASPTSEYAGRIARFDIVISQDPFSMSAAEQLSRLETVARDQCHERYSPWFGSMYSFGGVTAGTVDLRAITQSDQSRIQLLVTIGILCALLLMLQQIFLSIYLVLTVLLSYLSTLGCTYLFFSWMNGDGFIGLNWKVPLFLFVILVAVGQDYNVFLVTRVMEERRKQGNMAGLYRAMVQTGGIITGCGIIMAATFASMSIGSISRWLGQQGVPHWLGGNSEQLSLSGILELGFALSLGVLIDTLIVRTILVPSALAIATKVRRLM